MNALSLLQTVFGYAAFRGHQADIIAQLQQGGDALVLMPTGGGKSLCYQIPALLRPGCAIVVSPLIALMQDQVEALQQLGVAAALLNSSLDAQQAAAVEQQLRRGELNLLYVAPERLLTERFLTLLDQTELALFAIDEAHCVSQWGHDFRPEYMQLSVLHQRFPHVPRIALTATADALTRQEIIERLALQQARVFLSSFDRPNIRYQVVEKHNPRQQLLQFLRTEHPGDAGIVYCLSRKKVEETAAWLQSQGLQALPYHAGMDSARRARHQQQFLREEGWIMVATVAFGMGIDKPDVRFVAHLDLPKSLEGYYQETGRAGRDGLAASAWMSYGLQDVLLLREMIEQSQADPSHKQVERQKLDAMLGYCEAPSCRRQVLLRYFDEAAPVCGNCDLCLDPPETWDASVAVQKALSTIYRSGQRFGASHIISILRGQATARVQELGHQQLSTFGMGRDISEAQWRSLLRQVTAAGWLDVTPHGGLQLHESCRPILRGEQSVALRQVQDNGKIEARRRPATQANAQANPFTASADVALWQALRQCRKQLADEQAVPAYIIFGDATLRHMVEQRPQNLEDLSEIFGVGERKLERYGAAFLQVLQAHP